MAQPRILLLLLDQVIHHPFEIVAVFCRPRFALLVQIEKDFIFPTGRSWAEDLDYPPELANIPESAVESFAGVANPFSLGRLEPGEIVVTGGTQFLRPQQAVAFTQGAAL